MAENNRDEKTEQEAMSAGPAQKVCFCIMPIAVRPEYGGRYSGSGGSDHFRLVFERLFAPAAEILGYEAVFPAFEGSVPIPAQVVKQLTEAALCIGDISTLNPNVFLELGVRLATDKPLALVRDETVAQIPFDTGSVGHFMYDSELSQSKVDQELPALVECLRKTLDLHEQMSYWKIFKLQGSPERLQPATHSDQQLADLEFCVQRLTQGLSQVQVRSVHGQPPRISGSHSGPFRLSFVFEDDFRVATASNGQIVVHSAEVQLGKRRISFTMPKGSDISGLRKLRRILQGKLPGWTVFFPIEPEQPSFVRVDSSGRRK